MIHTDILLSIARDFAIAFVVGVCWGVLFGTPKKVLIVAGLLGGLGHCLRFILLELDFGLIMATLTGSVAIGFIGIVAAHRVDNPPVVFTMPACITMIPGMYAYKTMLAGIKITDLSVVDDNPTILITMAHNLTLTMSLLFTLAIGICIAALLFRQTSVKEIEFAKKIERMTHFK
ncbi:MULTISPECIES: threonine/serine exporter family protein [unclassified Dysgonomonas]|uniref:threonine/serine exporter family protein n=1 Tax=unclassified Dysgonomonas TaxID=2630389 RepID=UPI000680DB29|nr:MULTISPECIES: threonine/serine exporter family protein [unclassified Dysgonomonas]MBD8347152.1 threonine/serine exporter family protein [Dysgonomonas sp. HGC4]MBF0574909.1 threonine/serine exporter family protein [Dysgonomonas sp. GY617]